MCKHECISAQNGMLSISEECGVFIDLKAASRLFSLPQVGCAVAIEELCILYTMHRVSCQQFIEIDL